MPKPRIAVIGGGISGLATALTFAGDPSVEFELFEAQDRLGGVIESLRDGEYLIEKGADNFATLVPDALELSEEVGIADSLIRPNADDRQAFVLNRQQLCPIPLGFSLMQPTRVLPILMTASLSWRGKFRLLAEYFIPRGEGAEDESLESFAVRRLGREAYENLVEPIVSGIFTADPTTLSMQATMPQFLEMEKQYGGLIRGYLAAKRKDAAAVARKASGARYDQFTAPRGGMSEWINQLSAQLPRERTHLGVKVTELSQSDDAQWKLKRSPAGGIADIAETFDGVVVALPAASAASLLADCLPQVSGMVKQIPYASSLVAAVVVKRHEIHGRIDGFGLIVPRKENRSTLAISYSSNKYPGRVPEDEILLRVFMGGALNPAVLEKSDEQVLELAAEELREILDWRGKVPVRQTVIRWQNAMPQYLVGHVERMNRLDEQLESVPSLKLCGAAYRGVGIPQCVRGGRRAAQQLIEHFGKHGG